MGTKPMNQRPPSLLAVHLLALLPLASQADPVINEIMCRPGVGYPEDTTLEFVEIHNPDSEAVDLSDWALTRGADYTFPAGTSLAAGGFLVVVADVSAFQAAHPGVSAVFGPWESGETVPTIFYDRFDNTLKSLEGLVKEKDDTVKGQPCHVISALRYNKAIRLWISKQRFLILKREQEINFEDRTYISGKDQIAGILKVTGEEVNLEEIRLVQKETIKGWVTEIQRNIVVDEPISKEELEPSKSKAE